MAEVNDTRNPPSKQSQGMRHASPRAARSLEFAALILLTLVVLSVFLGPAAFDLAVPWSYDSGDGLSHAMVVKGIMQSGWLGYNPFLGAPFGSDEFDYPHADLLHHLLIGFIAAFSADWVVVANLFILSGFVLAALAAYLVLRDVGTTMHWAMCGSVLFAFLPYHVLRITEFGHLFLASCYSVPLACWIALRQWPTAHATAGHAWTYSACIIVGSSGIYYAYFGCLLILAAGGAAAIERRELRHFTKPIILAAMIALVAALNTAPHWIHRVGHGINREIAARTPNEAELFALKPIQLLLPQPEHRLAKARALAERYAAITPLTNENRTAALGAVASFGLLLALVLLFVRFTRGATPINTVDRIAVLCVACLTLAVVGGLGSVLAWTLIPGVRAYNRISIFIGWLALAAFLLEAQRARIGRINLQLGSPSSYAAAALVALAGLWDQTATLESSKNAATFASDRAFVYDIQNMLPVDAMVYQLPYHPYPEGGDQFQLRDYGLLRGYLHSNSLRWSYGAARGRRGDAWLRKLSELPMNEQLREASARGFTAVYVDRRGFVDRGARIEGVLTTELGPMRIESSDGHLAMYSLSRLSHDHTDP